jgi:hypothetical protein
MEDSATIPTSAPESSAPDTLDEARTARCENCGTKVSWKGAITADMIARTFTRGVDDRTGLPNCPRCAAAMVLVLEASADEAIAEAAREMPDRVERQGRIPGLFPAFNFEAAFTSIIEQRRVVKAAEVLADRKSADAKSARKDADEKQTKLSELEDEYTTRAEEAAAEANLTPGERRARTCAFERATGTPCAICRSWNATNASPEPNGNGEPAHIAVVAYNLAVRHQLRAEDLMIALEQTGPIAIDRGVIDLWNDDERLAVARWLALRDDTRRPEVLGRAHQVGGPVNACAACGALLYPLAAARGLEGWAVGQLVGVDCPGPPPEVVTPPRARASRKRRKEPPALKSAPKKAAGKKAARRR